MKLKGVTAVTAVAGAAGVAFVLLTPSAAMATVNCTAPSSFTDRVFSTPYSATYTKPLSLKFTLPNGGTVTVTNTTPTMTAAYAAARGKLTSVCYDRNPIPR